MNNELYETLKTLDIPVFYATRGESDIFPSIVFNIQDNPVTVMDDVDEWIEYYITINIYANAQEITGLIEKVNKLLLPKGYRRQMCPSMFYDVKLRIYNQALVYQYYSEKIYSQEEEK